MKRRTIYALIALFIIIPIGFLTKFYSGIAASWVNNSLGGVFYEIFWCLVLFIIFPKMKALTIALLIFLVTCGLEFTQLWKPVFLLTLRRNFIVRTIIGSSFAWSDIIYYVIGSLAGFGVIQTLKSKSKGEIKAH